MVDPIAEETDFVVALVIWICTTSNSVDLVVVPCRRRSFLDGAGSVWTEPAAMNVARAYLSVSICPDEP